MDEWQAVDQYRHIIAIVMSCPLLCGDGILVDDLQTVIMDALLVNKLNIFAFPVIPAEHLHIVLLNQAGFSRMPEFVFASTSSQKRFHSPSVKR